jgi:hypothetical protein
MRRHLIGKLGFVFMLTAIAGGLARAAVPPAFVTRQQDRAVRVYCAEWRKTHGNLSASEMNKRVIIRLEERYPMAFPDCRPSDPSTCLGWLNALVEGLGYYGERSLTSVCSNFGAQGESIEPPR